MGSGKTQGMAKAYNPSQHEERLYKLWLDKGYFKPKIGRGRQPFCIIMPPPNVTAALHLGHALTATIEDCLTRWHRMKGDAALWLPGVDHAGIATQNVIEKELAKEGLSRHDLGREKFLALVWDWVRQYRSVISDQHRRLGASCDWERERFTMDEGPQRAVRTTFIRLFKDGLIYRGERIINWCPRCETALSDLEVEHTEHQGHLWYVRYPLLDEADHPSDEAIVIATTRPETIVADVAVAVNPTVKRWRKVIGRTALLPIIERRIPIIADEAVDPKFGTGALKITPGHDQLDFEIGERHGLPPIVAIAPDGTMNEEAGPYEGMDRFECREQIVADLERLGFIEKTEDYVYSLGHCQRCDTVVEPVVSKQWFVRMEPLAKPAIEVIKEGQIKIVPPRFKRVYLHWMENIRDWCISRQLWWGHRIPVWYCQNCDGLTVAMEDPSACAQCGSEDIQQDPDVLDTWFSSGLWPHSTLGWPDDTEDLRRFYPTSVLETGYDILFFWVARMIMMGLYNMGDRREKVEDRVPFRFVYLHGLIRDAQGRKMTKSLGNVIDPLEMIDKYGCDALRYALATGGAPGNDFRLTEERLEAGRNFANKIWNAGRFVIQSLEEHGPVDKPEIADGMPLEDRWILSLTHVTVGGTQSLGEWGKGVNQLLEEFQIGEAGQRLYGFFWHDFCDWYIEMAKIRLKTGDLSPIPVLAYVLDVALRLLHPFIPFVTEAVWQELMPYLKWTEVEALIIAPWPKKEPQIEIVFPMVSEEMDVVRKIVQAVREFRIIDRVPPSGRIPTVVLDLSPALTSAEWAASQVKRQQLTEDDSEFLLQHMINLPHRVRQTIENNAQIIRELARVERIPVVERFQDIDNERYILLGAGHVNVRVHTAGLIDIEAERARLSKQLAEAEAEAGRVEAKLANRQFREKAPPQVVSREEERLAAARGRLEALQERLAELGQS